MLKVVLKQNVSVLSVAAGAFEYELGSWKQVSSLTSEVGFRRCNFRAVPQKMMARAAEMEREARRKRPSLNHVVIFTGYGRPEQTSCNLTSRQDQRLFDGDVQERRYTNRRGDQDRDSYP